MGSFSAHGNACRWRFVFANAGIVLLFIFLSTSPSSAACTIATGFTVDGFAAGTSVECPTGTLQLGTAIQDGAEIESKVVNGGGTSTTFTFTNPGGGGAVTGQYAGEITLVAASSTGADETALVGRFFGAATANSFSRFVQNIRINAINAVSSVETALQDIGAEQSRLSQREDGIRRDIILIDSSIEKLTDDVQDLEAQRQRFIERGRTPTDDLIASLTVSIERINALINLLEQQKDLASERINEISVQRDALTKISQPSPTKAELIGQEIGDLEDEANNIRSDIQSYDDRIKALGDGINNIKGSIAGATGDTALSLGKFVQLFSYEIDEKQDLIKEFEARKATNAERLNKIRTQIENLEKRRDSLRTSPSAATPQPPSQQFSVFENGSNTHGIGDRSNLVLSTAFSLVGLLSAAQSPATGVTTTDEPLPGARPVMPENFDVYAQLTFSSAENDQNSAGHTSRSIQGSVGLDYRVNERLSVGLAGTLSSALSKTTSIDSRTESTSYLIGPYVSYEAWPDIFLTAAVSAGSMDTERTLSGTRSEYQSLQGLATVGVSGVWRDGDWTYTPSMSASYFRSRSDTFVDSSDTTHAADSSESGTFNFGPQVAYNHVVNGDLVEAFQPSLRISGTHRFTASQDTHFSDGSILTRDRISASINPALNVEFNNGVSAYVSYVKSGLFGDLDGWSLTTILTAPAELVLPGAPPNGTTNLQLAAAPNGNMSVKLRIEIPLN